MLSRLPFEIIEIVNSYITLPDRTQLVKVNKKYHDKFTQLLYKSITITSDKQLQHLLYLFQQSEERQHTASRQHLGHCVHHLSLALDSITEQNLLQIQHFCPFLQSIYIDWRIWNYLAYKIEDPHSTVRNYFPRREWPSAIIDFISYYGSSRLSSLTLDIHRMHGKSHLSMSKDEILLNTGGRNILRHTPYLRHLTLIGVNQYVNVSFNFIESIHRLCPLLETLSIDAYQAEALSDCLTPSVDAEEAEGGDFVGHQDSSQLLHYLSSNTTPSPFLRSFSLKSQYGADRYYEWLPFLAFKYPNLQSVEFHHVGTGKDMMVPFCRLSLYHLFLSRCPHIVSLKWYNAAPDFRFFQEMDKQKYSTLKRLELYDEVALPDLLYRALFDWQYANILQNVTELALGPLPTESAKFHQQSNGIGSNINNVRSSPDSLIKAVGLACPKLRHLTLQEPYCNLSMPYKIDTILDCCTRLKTLTLDRIALRLSTPPPPTTALGIAASKQSSAKTTLLKHHPLEKLTMRHCSSFDGVFDHISYRCRDLKELELFAFTQRDRRYKVLIHMPYQSFTKVQFHGLRTEAFDVGRRIRFFSITSSQQQQQQTDWCYMDQFHLCDQESTCGRNTYHYRCCLEIADHFAALTGSEACFLRQLLAKPVAWEDVELLKKEFLERNCCDSTIANWEPKDIYDAGYVDFVCHKVDRLEINKKRILNE